MNKFALCLNPVLAALVLGACSTTPKLPDNAWKIAPVQTVRHGGTDATESHLAVGRYREERGAHDQAISAYRQAVDADPGYTSGWSALGALLAKLGQYDEALQALQRAVDLAPAASYLHNNLGYALLLAGRDEAAAAALRRAVELDDDNRRAWSNLAQAYRRLGRPDLAAKAGDHVSGRRRPGQLATGKVSVAMAPNPAAVTVTPVIAPAPLETMAQAGSPAASLAPAPAAPAPFAASATTTGPTQGARLIRIADNVFELRNAAARPRAPVAEAAAIVSAATAPSPSPRTPAASRAARYEITNGHGGAGLARRLAVLLGKQGLARPRLTNDRPFNQPASYIEYRDGYAEAAASFAALLPFRPQLQAAPDGSLAVDVRLMLGRDLTTSDACAVLELCAALADAGAPATPSRQPAQVADAAPDRR